MEKQTWQGNGRCIQATAREKLKLSFQKPKRNQFAQQKYFKLKKKKKQVKICECKRIGLRGKLREFSFILGEKIYLINNIGFQHLKHQEKKVNPKQVEEKSLISIKSKINEIKLKIELMTAKFDYFFKKNFINIYQIYIKERRNKL